MRGELLFHHLPHHAHPSLEIDFHEVCACGVRGEVEHGERRGGCRL